MIFLPEVYTPLCDYKLLWYIYLKYTHLRDFLPKVYTPLCDYIHAIFFTRSMFTSVWHLCNFLNLKFIHIWVILHPFYLFPNWSIYTPVQLNTYVIFHLYTSVQLYASVRYIHLFDFFSWIIYTSVFLHEVYTLLCDYTSLWFFYLRNIHLCGVNCCGILPPKKFFS